MKKTVTLDSLVKAKSDLELYIKLEQTKRLRKLFDPDFELKDTNSKIDKFEDQLMIVKEAIQLANTITKDSDGHSINYYIYLLSKHNRSRADLLILLDRVNTNTTIVDKSKVAEKLLADIREVDTLIETAKKAGDKKKEAEYTSTKSKLKRSLTKTSQVSKTKVAKVERSLNEELERITTAITDIKAKLTALNASAKSQEIEVLEGFEMVVK